MNPIITLEGRLTGDPELRFTPGGKAVCSLTIVTSDRKKNETTNEWEDIATTFWRCSAWERMAENIAETLRKGHLVIASGKVSQRDYETREGDKRTVFEVRLYQIGPALQFDTATVNKAERRSQAPADAPPVNDPWATPATAGSDEPPF